MFCKSGLKKQKNKKHLKHVFRSLKDKLDLAINLCSFRDDGYLFSPSNLSAVFSERACWGVFMAPCTTSLDKDKRLAADIKSSSGEARMIAEMKAEMPSTKLRTANCLYFKVRLIKNKAAPTQEMFHGLYGNTLDLRASS